MRALAVTWCDSVAQVAFAMEREVHAYPHPQRAKGTWVYSSIGPNVHADRRRMSVSLDPFANLAERKKFAALHILLALLPRVSH